MKAKNYSLLVSMIITCVLMFGFISERRFVKAEIQSRHHALTDTQEQAIKVLMNMLESIKSGSSSWVLEGLDAVVVSPPVPIIFDDEPHFTISELQKQIELRVRQAGIKVCDISNLGESTFNILYVNITVEPFGPFYELDVVLKLQEPVYLFRNPRIFTVATTYQASFSTLSSELQFSDNCPTRADVWKAFNMVLDEFVNDYFKANKNLLTDEKDKK